MQQIAARSGRTGRRIVERSRSLCMSVCMSVCVFVLILEQCWGLVFGIQTSVCVSIAYNSLEFLGIDDMLLDCTDLWHYGGSLNISW